MRAIVGDRPLNGILGARLGQGSCVLFRYGPGTGGDLLLKQLFSDCRDDVYSVMISTHETVDELRRSIKACDVIREPEMISLLPMIIDGLEPVKRQDRFRAEGVMVTDLLEMTGKSQERRPRGDLNKRMLSALTVVSSKQVLPFKLVIDSISDLAEHTSLEELKQRLHILKEALRDKKGWAFLGAPMDWDPWNGGDLTLFDAIIELRAVEGEGGPKRVLRFSHMKGSPDLPEELEVTFEQSIPSALSV
ncbi:MAG: hypothetical protein MUC62_08560 [Candidatus Thermoplasmatota archaeon]|jgi:hypothetical protein|nr:hypothetical protein [Candidatus Thermoplasmatota archaeon]